MRKNVRRGFTLAEVLVTVTIVAVLAAVMVPAVINQVSKGDVPSVAQDVSGIQTAVNTFAADIRHFPAKLSELGGDTLSGSAHDFILGTFSSDTTRYRGPYASLVSGHIGPTGAIFADSLVNTSATAHDICMQDSLSGGASLISPSQALELEAAIDHGTANDSATGRVRWSRQTVAGLTTIVPSSVKVCVATY